jgi:transcriptional regulator with XRE-family HTH domain
MILVITPSKAQKKLAANARLKRLNMDLTQEGVAARSGVPLPTLRKFEQKGIISLEGFLKLQMVLGGLENIVEATRPMEQQFSSIDEVIEADNRQLRKRGRRK